MASASDLSDTLPVRMLLIGDPGAGKTGALVSLINAGFKLRVLDFDNNIRPILAYADPKMLKNVDIMTFADETRITGQGLVEPVGIPAAYSNGLRALDSWSYTNPDGSRTDLGCAKDWGDDTIVVLDSLTSQGAAAMSRTLNLNNRTVNNRRIQDWGAAAQHQLNFIDRIRHPSHKFHFVAIAHMRLIGPKEVLEADDAVTVRIKREAALHIPTKFWPNAIGQGAPKELPSKFETILKVERRVDKDMKSTRVITTEVGEELDTKLPAAKCPKTTFDLDTGLLEVFNALVPHSVAKVQAANQPSGAKT